MSTDAVEGRDLSPSGNVPPGDDGASGGGAGGGGESPGNDIFDTIARHGKFAADVAMMAIVAGFFIYVYLSSFGWQAADARLPRLAVYAGSVVWVIRAVALATSRIRKSGPKAKDAVIMDTVIGNVGSPRAAGWRMLTICAFVAVLYLLIWLIGFHISVPLVVGAYLLIVARMRWYAALMVAAVFEGFILGVFDQALQVIWPAPALAGAMQYLFGVYLG